jgi:predicted TIM-barrel fold metal-dependent hydrolase
LEPVPTIDCHAHLEPRMLDVAGLIAKMDAAGIDRVALIPAMNDPLPHVQDRLLATMRRAMRTRLGRPLAAALARATITHEGDLKYAGAVYQIYDRPDNAAVARVLEAHPERFRGWIFLNPRGNPGVVDELERWRATPGMIGIKLHPHWHRYRVPAAARLLARAEELGLPVLVHLGFGARGDYRALADRFPRLRVLFAHAGMPFFRELWAFARGRRNLFVDLSSPYLDEALACAAVAALGAGHCLYGTDAPYGFRAADGSYDYGRIRGWVERLPIGAAERDQVLGGNFQELVGG